MPKVTMYSTTTCPYCRAEKAYFKEKGIEFLKNRCRLRILQRFWNKTKDFSLGHGTPSNQHALTRKDLLARIRATP